VITALCTAALTVQKGGGSGWHHSAVELLLCSPSSSVQRQPGSGAPRAPSACAYSNLVQAAVDAANAPQLSQEQLLWISALLHGKARQAALPPAQLPGLRRGL
jgi:hypothetical protein